MAGFVAPDRIEALDFSFKPWLDVSGTVPEPSEATVLAYHRAYLAQLGLEPGATPEDRRKKLAELEASPVEEQIAHVARLREVVAQACGGCPTREQVDALPFRVVRVFATWLLDEFTNPKPPSAATSA